MTVPRRIVTGHDADGRSVVLSDAPAPKSHALEDATFHELWNTTETPAPVGPAEELRPADGPIVTPPAPVGTKIRIVDFAPQGRSPMHRTESVDYGIVLEGTVVLVLDDGSQTELRAGDVVVQRGTDHAWVNRRTSRHGWLRPGRRPLQRTTCARCSASPSSSTGRSTE